jgi:hypothetical protein
VEDVFTHLQQVVAQDRVMEIQEVEHPLNHVVRLDLDRVLEEELVPQQQLAGMVLELLDVEKYLTLMDQVKIMDVVVLDQE